MITISKKAFFKKYPGLYPIYAGARRCIFERWKMGKVFILSRSRPPWELFISVRFTGKVNAPKIRGVNAPKFGLVNALKMDVVAAPKTRDGPSRKLGAGSPA